MARISVFADESGNFDFVRKPGASKYFILTTVTVRGFEVGEALLRLRRDLAWDGLGGDSEFHATDDKQAVRDRVFDMLRGIDFRVDATIFEKAKAQPQTRTTPERFYQYAWFYHLRHVVPRVVRRGDELFVCGASVGTKKKRKLMHEAVKDVVRQVARGIEYRTAYWMASSEPCLQVADYCCWAVSRKWEGGDDRSHRLIAPKIGSEFDIWERGTMLYY